ncbi:DUF881 domain-containing protein [Cytobacillus gottheilii]|uniref:DUF881 domain-containing protein n=1 Tax=Cytobacillus gottheilii TaxID=859144 RepID=A0ABX8FGP2_9BACI|nr:DUF881 domain-containing protein [Cytobacillus gottheilii]QVY63199.1 DUF881 domain-containing protein [Cytobacillus gottheilii]
MDKKWISFTFIAIIVGFMLALQFNTLQEPAVRDTRDTWQLREDLEKEKEMQVNLLREIRSQEEILSQYESEREQSKELALRETLEELKKEAGLSDIEGFGILLTIEPVYEELLMGNKVTTVSPELLKRLLNELNMYDALYVSIGGQRVINTTVIRDINGETKINGFSLNDFPIEIKVIAENRQVAEKLYNRMQVSKSAEEFFIDNLRVKISKPESMITIPAYEDSIRIRDMEPVEADKGGNS